MSIRPFVSPRFYYTFGAHPASLTIRSGERLRVTCPDSDNELGTGELLSDTQRQQQDGGAGSAPFAGNPMAGPIAVEGAAAGDCLAVTIHAIELDRTTGQTLLAPAHGAIPDHLLRGADRDLRVPQHMYRWRIDAGRDRAVLTNPLGGDGIDVALRPFVGCIGVCPPHAQSISTLYCGPFGGNMDVPCVRPAATLYLPVHCDGALLMMGDLHAAQGHGEVIGGAIETSGVIDCTVRLIKNNPIPGPRVRDAETLYVIATEGDLRAGVQRAYAGLVDWLTGDFGMNRWDAYNLVSQTGSIMLGGVGTAPYAVAGGIPLAALPPAARARVREEQS
jgi:amidase